MSIYESINGVTFYASWRCKFYNYTVNRNAQMIIKNNIKLFKYCPQMFGGDEFSTYQLIEFLENLSDDQSWTAKKTMAELSIEKIQRL